MILSNSILEDIRLAVGLSKDTSDFDTELLMHINASIGKLNQNGVGEDVIVSDITTSWSDLKGVPNVENDNSFKMVPLLIALNTKILFDPPPPSSVQLHQAAVEQLLWRLKISYEEPLTTATTISNGDW